MNPECLTVSVNVVWCLWELWNMFVIDVEMSHATSTLSFSAWTVLCSDSNDVWITITCQAIGWEECLRNDIFFVKWDWCKPNYITQWFAYYNQFLFGMRQPIWSTKDRSTTAESTCIWLPCLFVLVASDVEVDVVVAYADIPGC